MVPGPAGIMEVQVLWKFYPILKDQLIGKDGQLPSSF